MDYIYHMELMDKTTVIKMFLCAPPCPELLTCPLLRPSSPHMPPTPPTREKTASGKWSLHIQSQAFLNQEFYQTSTKRENALH